MTISFKNSDGYTLTVSPQDDRIIVAVGVGSSGHAICLSRDEAHSLHTDLGALLGRFELADSE